jgi:DNA-binding NtrC family response regulator
MNAGPPLHGHLNVVEKCKNIFPAVWGTPVKLIHRPEQEVDVRRELDSLVTQMHSSGIRYEDAVREFKRQYLREVLMAHRGNQCKAAEELGMHRNTLSRAMAELGLELAEVRAGVKRPPRSERPVYGALRQGYR